MNMCITKCKYALHNATMHTIFGLCFIDMANHYIN